jgi:hypothetical protein
MELFQYFDIYSFSALNSPTDSIISYCQVSIDLGCVQSTDYGDFLGHI